MTSVGEGTARGGRLLVVTRCAPLLDCGAGLLPFEPTHYALKRSVQTGSRWQQLSSSPYGGSANVTTSSLPPLT